MRCIIRHTRSLKPSTSFSKTRFTEKKHEILHAALDSQVMTSTDRPPPASQIDEKTKAIKRMQFVVYFPMHHFFDEKTKAFFVYFFNTIFQAISVYFFAYIFNYFFNIIFQSITVDLFAYISLIFSI